MESSNRGKRFIRGFRRAGFRGYRNNRKPLPPRNLTTNNISASGIYNPQSETTSRSPKCSGPYNGWKLYFQDVAYEKGNLISLKLNILESYFELSEFSGKYDEIRENGFFIVDYKMITSNSAILSEWPNIQTDIRENPERTLNLLGLAMHQVLFNGLINDLYQLTGENIDNIKEKCHVSKIFPQVINFDPVVPLKTIKSNYYGKFVSVKGTVVKVSNIKPIWTKKAFKCGKCHLTLAINQPYGNYTLPSKCITKGCRGQSFDPMNFSELNEKSDWQSIKLQEISSFHGSGEVPKAIDVELMSDLVNTCVPGDIVSICGTVLTTSTEVKERGKDECTFLLYILANSVNNLKGRTLNTEREALSISALDVSLKDESFFERLRSEEKLFKLLVASLCPSIYGHEMVKAGLILGLFGGSQINLHVNKDAIPVRGDLHMLVVGDPGLGKSQMLQAVANISPRGVFVCGNTTTMSGLTVTMSRESASGDYAFEAGALILADQGTCCIDEFDKMSNQHNALLEAMEQQTISVAKAGMVCCLPARTSIIAAANPIGGHYDRSKTVSENLRMKSALLSRFDLVFILLDKPNVELDCKLSEHVIELHTSNFKQSFSSQQMTIDDFNFSLTRNNGKNLSVDIEKGPLINRLKYKSEEFDPVPHQLLRKYIAYARKNLRPTLNLEAQEVLQKFYLELRDRMKSSNSTPITLRQLESLKRLTEARAKLELRQDCTEQDALDAVEIMKHSMVDVWSDEFGVLHTERSQLGSGMSKRSSAKRFIAALNRESERLSNSLFTVDRMKSLMNEMAIHVPSFTDFLDSLNIQGYLIKKGPKVYKLLTTDY